MTEKRIATPSAFESHFPRRRSVQRVENSAFTEQHSPQRICGLMVNTKNKKLWIFKKRK